MDRGLRWTVARVGKLARRRVRPPRGRVRRPRRLPTPRHGLTIRREMTRDGWTLHVTGREATSGLLDTVFDEIERLFGPG